MLLILEEIDLIKGVWKYADSFLMEKRGCIMGEKKKIYLASPTMNGQEMRFIQEAFETNWVAPLGKNVDEFEREMAAYVGTNHAAALSAGTAALHLAVKLAGIKRGDVVLSSALTFAATCNPVAYEGGKLVFIDSEQDTWNMSPEALEEGFKRYPEAKVVLLVHLYGTPAKMKEILKICERHGAVLIEDAAEALGSSYNAQRCGSFGQFGILSFNGNKIITTSGGGMLLSNDEKAIKKSRFLATQAREPVRHYEHKEIGYNYRMSNIVAGIGRGQLLTLDAFKQKKQEMYHTYQEAFADIPEVQMNPMNPDGQANNWLSCITISREGMKRGITPLYLMEKLEKENIETRPIWKPMNLQPVYQKNDFIQIESVNGVSVGEDIFNRGICLPSDVKNTNDDMKKIIGLIRGCFDE
ncbi:DegT/DnrJ/EryC1/StrS aminotransferase family protein [[Clostridium] symbiosum ATCC 14940]|uniref:DegT/DnrJ/EryC1/StrS aminotransferase family protein n=2 Tax=Clostridium symbiosum TaxID=1512 RepID=A0ABC9TYC5_CLOSY|nr:DegT/DnrJ/EryC1/StrS aminotransferase family protein [[Clostridium] symbiosum ATCC 14940]